jgi:hypothetical protein
MRRRIRALCVPGGRWPCWGWHSLPEAPNERLKVNVFIMGRELRADGVRAAVFRQRREANGSWADVAVEEGTVSRLEDAILTRARELRLAQR